MESLINLRYYYNTVQVHSDMPLYHNMRVCHLDFGGFHYKVKKKVWSLVVGAIKELHD